MSEHSEQAKNKESKIRLNPCLIIISGPPLMGKDTIAIGLATKTNLLHLDVDTIRSEFDETRKTDLTSLLPPNQELEIMVHSYQILCERAKKQIVTLGHPVVLTGTFSKPEFQAPLLLLQEQLEQKGISVRIFQLNTPNEDITKRIEQRQREGSKSNIDTVEKFKWAKGFYTPLEGAIVVENVNGQAEVAVIRIIENLQDIQIV